MNQGLFERIADSLRSPWFRDLPRRPLLAAALVLPCFAALFLALPGIPDTDSYYHLAVARLYGAEGFVRGLPWARLSILGSTLGDKELLFHILLIPFSSSTSGGRLALALLNSAVVGVIGAIATRVVGRRGAWIGIGIYLTAGAFFFRTFRLRPEVLGLLLLLVFVDLLARRRAGPAGLVAAIFTLSYTAWHLVAGLAFMVFCVTALVERRRDWGTLLLPIAGVGAGVVLHPHFPDNVRIFWLQDVLYFLRKSVLDVGNEIAPAVLWDFLRYNPGWLYGLAVLWFFRRRGARSHERLVFTTVAIVFGVMFLLMERMATYALPFITLAALFNLSELSRRTLALLAAGVLLSAPGTIHEWRSLVAHTIDEAGSEDMASALPAGARVAATWTDATGFVWFAPRGRYLNILDPIFMAERFPQEYEAQRALFRGVDPDVPFTALHSLDSDHIAYFAGTQQRAFTDRLLHDPRIRIVREGAVVVARIVDAGGTFVSDWRISLPGSATPVACSVRDGFVDVGLWDAPCVEAQSRIGAGTWEFAPYGPGVLSIDGTPRIRMRDTLAILGTGATFTIEGDHEVAVSSCRGPFSPRNGFYLLRRRTSG